MTEQHIDGESPEVEQPTTLVASTTDAPPKLSRRKLLVDLGIGGAGAIAIFAAALFTYRWNNSNKPVGLTFVIPEGAGATVGNSTLISAIVLPTEVVFEPGEEAAISVTNEDTVPLRAGPFVVLPGQTYVQRFPNPGKFDIACTVDPAESITVTVKE